MPGRVCHGIGPVSRRYSTPDSVKSQQVGLEPLTPSSGYAAIAACECPGTSISGTIVTKRAAAYAAISRRSSWVE